jgi:hypothetical protein
MSLTSSESSISLATSDDNEYVGNAIVEDVSLMGIEIPTTGPSASKLEFYEVICVFIL